MTIEIRRLLLADTTKSAITELRAQAYSPKFGNRLREAALSWNRHDDDSFHFGAYDGENLISTIRLTRVERPDLFETLMQLSAQDSFASLPCWVLSRAATAPTYLGHSVNMQLRSEAYRFILSRQQASAQQAPPQEKYVFGTALKDSQRISFLQSLGYEVQPGRQKWDGYIVAEPSEVSTFRLAIDKIHFALSKIDSGL